MQPHEHVRSTKEILKKDEQGITKFNTKFALKITNGVGTMWTAYLFSLLALFSLPAVLVGVFPKLATSFPGWLLKTSLIALVAWIAQTFLQLVLLPIIMVGQNTIQAQNDAKAEVDHETLTYLATLQDRQMKELEGITEILKEIKKHDK